MKIFQYTYTAQQHSGSADIGPYIEVRWRDDPLDATLARLDIQLYADVGDGWAVDNPRYSIIRNNRYDPKFKY